MSDSDYWAPPVPREHGYRDPDPEADVEPYHGQGITYPAPPIDAERQRVNDNFDRSVGSSIIDADVERRRIVKLLRSLPFNDLVSDPLLPDLDKVDELYLAWLYEWLLGYRRVVQAQSDLYTRQARLVGRLLDERAAVRGFFGLADEAD